jgi:serine/threonine protein kinase
VESDLRSAEGTEAQVEHLERQPIALRLVILPHVTATLEQPKQPVNGRWRLAQRSSQLRQAEAAGACAQHLTHFERFVDGRQPAGLALCSRPIFFHYMERRFSLLTVPTLREGCQGTRPAEGLTEPNVGRTMTLPFSVAREMSLKVGQTLGQYKILDMLGAGGMGVVYKAQDTRLGRLVALKVLPLANAGDGEATERFRREARTASSLNHSNICTIYNFDEQDGQLFLAMELLEGGTLDAKLSGHPLPLPLLLDLGTQIADALENAHNDGILHRDIKPANIFITYRGQVKILDFGLAKLTPGLKDRRQPDLQPTEQFTSQVGTTVGTISYMSPEQARGEDLDPRTDLFSLGVVLYEMATGRPSFPGATTAVVFDGILNRQPAPASALNAAIPAELDRIITKALEKERELRYQGAADLRADLQRLKRDSGLRPSAITVPTSELAAATVIIPAPDRAPSSALRARRWSWQALAIAGSVALVIVAVAAMILTRSGPSDGAEIQSVTAAAGVAPAASGSGVSEPPAPSTVAPGSALMDKASTTPAPSAVGTPAATAAPVSVTASSSPASKEGALPPTTPAPAPALRNAEAAARERLDIARAKLNSNLLEPALADLRQIFIDFPSSAAAAEASFMSAEILERLGRLEEAMAAHIEFNKRFAKDPRLPASKLRLAQLTLQSRQPDRETRARQILGEIATAHPKTSHALAALQMKLKLEQGRGPREMDPVLGIEVPRALPTLRALAEQFPTSPMTTIALNRLAELYLDIEDYPRAAQAYTDLATSFPDNPNDAWFRAGEIYERRLKDVDKARAAYARVPEGTARYRDAQRRLK